MSLNWKNWTSTAYDFTQQKKIDYRTLDRQALKEKLHEYTIRLKARLNRIRHYDGTRPDDECAYLLHQIKEITHLLSEMPRYV